MGVYCSAQSEQTPISEGNIDSQDIKNNTLPDESTLLLMRPDNNFTETSSATTSTFMLFVRMIVVLILVIACIYGIGRLLRKAANPTIPNDPYLKKVASVVLSPGKTAHVITIGSQAFIVGVADNAVSLIGEVHDKDLIDAMNFQSENSHSTKPKDFSSILSTFLPGNKQKNNSYEKDIPLSAVETGDFLKTQRERLRGSGFSEKQTKNQEENT